MHVSDDMVVHTTSEINRVPCSGSFNDYKAVESDHQEACTVMWRSMRTTATEGLKVHIIKNTTINCI